MKRLNCIVLFVLAAFCVTAQTDPGYKLYRFNALVLNPAQAGANEYSDVSVLGAQYWVGVPGAPQTASASGNFKVMDNFGIGAAVIKDQTGPVISNSINLMGAYHLKLNKNWKFSAGLKLSAIEHNVLLANLATTEQNDPDMQENLTTGLSYNAGFGFLVYSKKFYVGASVPRVAAMRFDRMDMSNFIDKKGGYIAYAGSDLRINDKLQFRPSLMTYFGYGGPLNLDLNAIFTANRKFDFGLNYQLKGSLGAIIGLSVKEKFYVGYSYGYPMNRLNTVSVQSHELALRMMFGKKVVTADSPRFFN
jgi:type IX secretion system PorP/SprF family membrane protein